MTNKYMTVEEFSSKVEWEGGIFGALEYGLHADQLDSEDSASTELRKAWADLESAYNELRPFVGMVESILEKIDEGMS